MRILLSLLCCFCCFCCCTSLIFDGIRHPPCRIQRFEFKTLPPKHQTTTPTPPTPHHTTLHHTTPHHQTNNNYSTTTPRSMPIEIPQRFFFLSSFPPLFFSPNLPSPLLSSPSPPLSSPLLFRAPLLWVELKDVSQNSTWLFFSFL